MKTSIFNWYSPNIELDGDNFSSIVCNVTIADLKSYKATLFNFNNKIESLKKAFNATPRNKRTIDSRFRQLSDKYNSAVDMFKQLITKSEAVDIFKLHNQLIKFCGDAKS